MNKEVRSFNFEIRADANEEHGHYIEGRAIVFNQKYDNGYFDEYILPEALAKCDLRDIRLLVNHNTDMIPLARSRNNNANSTMQLSVVPEGLDIRADLDIENNTDAKSLYSATTRGDISGMSFMMIVDGEEWKDLDTDHPVRMITSIKKIFEVSAVTWPAYTQTSLEARSHCDALESAEALLESKKAEYEKRMDEVNKKKQKIRILCEVKK